MNKVFRYLGRKLTQQEVDDALERQDSNGPFDPKEDTSDVIRKRRKVYATQRGWVETTGTPDRETR